MNDNQADKRPDHLPPDHEPPALQRPRRWARWAVNITPGERLARMLVGMTAIVAGTVLLTGGGSPLVITLEVLLIATGADLLITGALGHCPLYHKLGHMPRSLRGTR